MKSEWRVTSNLINGKKVYCAYRLLDTQEVDHSGNREHMGPWTDDRESTEALAAELNRKGDSVC